MVGCRTTLLQLSVYVCGEYAQTSSMCIYIYILYYIYIYIM